MDVMLIAVVLVALFFDFTNGFHDTANAVATSIATGAVSPKLAVLGAAIFNFLGAFVSLEVAATVAKGIVSPDVITLDVILAGLIGAIIWNLISWRFGLPTSSSHALIGGIAGSAVMAVGFGVIKWEGITDKVLIPSLAAPILGILGASALMLTIFWLIRKKVTRNVSHIFRRLQLVSASFVAFTHGTNDAQKTMGIIALALLASNPTDEFHVPFWVILSSATVMALGTYVGGWRIIHTLGHKVAKLEPPQGFAAETTTATILGFTAHFGFPVSTTHTISGSIMGAGAANGISAIRWPVVKHILIAWAITIPCAAAVGASMEALTRLPAGSIIASVLAVGIALVIFLTRSWTRESMDQLLVRLTILKKIRKL